MDLTLDVFELSKKFPETENYGIGYQIRRTVTNIPSNIAAAASWKYGKESLKYLSKAKAELYEVETLLHLAERLEFITEEEIEKIMEILDTSRRLLFGFIKYYKRTSSSSSTSY